jgi:hypothetical protein
MAADLLIGSRWAGCRPFPLTFAPTLPIEHVMPTAATSLQELSGLLWRERDVLQQLLVILHAGAEVVECEGLLRSISSLELHRAITTREVAIELGLDGEQSLDDLATASHGEWAEMLASHREELHRLAADVTAMLADRDTGSRLGLQRSLVEFLA